MSDASESLKEFFQEVLGTSPPTADAQYKCSKVPVQYSLELPIPITANGSTVRYAFGTDGADISFGIYIRKDSQSGGDSASSASAPLAVPSAGTVGGSGLPRPSSPSETEEDIPLVPSSRVASHISPISASFVIAEEAPCVVILCWDNHYSWFRTKTLSYSVTVKPPSETHLKEARKTRALEYLESAKGDLTAADARLARLKSVKGTLEMDIIKLNKALAEKEAALQQALKEEVYLGERVAVRKQQLQGLAEIAEHGTLTTTKI